MAESKFPKSVLVTGAEGALGSAVVDRFIAADCGVVGTFHKSRKESHRREKDVTWLEMDLSDSKAVREGVASLIAGGFYPDVLIHCVGGFRFSSIESLSDEDMDFLIDANLRSTLLILRELVPLMKERNFGRIVLIGAKSSLSPAAGMGAYAATKAGVNALVSSLSEEVKAYDINVNAVLPSIIDTPANRDAMKEADFSKWVSAEALAELVFTLTQPVSRPLHGALVPVAGRL